MTKAAQRKRKTVKTMTVMKKMIVKMMMTKKWKKKPNLMNPKKRVRQRKKWSNRRVRR